MQSSNIMRAAMQGGAILGVLFSANFLLSVPQNTITGLLTYLVMAVIIVTTHRLSVRFRDRECEGHIPYGRAFAFILLSFFFASLISAVVKIIYFQFINPGYLDALFNQSMLLMEKMGMADDMVESNLRNMLKPVTFALQYIWVNLLAGCFIGLIIAAVVRREKSIFDNQ